MAQRTLEEYIRIAENNGNQLTRDLNYQETKDVHDDVFVDNGLTLDNWTLNAPMELIRQKYGDEAIKNFGHKYVTQGAMVPMPSSSTAFC